VAILRRQRTTSVAEPAPLPPSKAGYAGPPRAMVRRVSTKSWAFTKYRVTAEVKLGESVEVYRPDEGKHDVLVMFGPGFALRVPYDVLEENTQEV